jgi:hypothetical protein
VIFLFYVVIMSFIFSSPVFSLENCTEEIHRDLGVSVVNCSGDNVCSVPTSPTSSGKTLASGSSVYILGDSITNQSRNELESAITANGYTISKIEADGGRAISYDSGGGDPTALEAVVTDARILSSSSAAVVALGTNSGNEDLNIQIPALLTEMRNSGFTGPVYWVNLFYTSGSGPEVRNAIIANQAQINNYTVIDTVSAGIQLNSDGVHPEGTGSATFALTIANGLSSLPINGVQVPPNTAGNCVCQVNSGGSLNNTITWGEGVWATGSQIYQSGLAEPQTIEQWAINVLKNIAIKGNFPEAEMVTQKKVISMVAWAKAEGGGVDGHVGTFNPLNTKGGSGSELGGSNQGNATTDSNSNGFPTFDKGVEGITRGLFNNYQKRIGSYLILPDAEFTGEGFVEAVAGDFYSTDGTSSGVVNRLEAIYPGDKIFAAASATGLIYDPVNNRAGDRDKYIKTKLSTLKNVRENYADYAGKVLESPRGVTPPGTPQPLVFSPSGPQGGTYTGGACQQNSGGSVSIDGYSFPLAPQNKTVGGITAGQQTSTHHDGTNAFDLFSPQDSAAVYSIFSGTPTRINTNVKGVAGCSSIQFKANDGFFYWYGHLKNVIVQEGVEIEAGVKMAEVADDSFGSACIGGGPHLHIDRGCSINGVPQTGGTDECRDPEFIPFLSKIYESLN